MIVDDKGELYEDEEIWTKATRVTEESQGLVTSTHSRFPIILEADDHNAQQRHELFVSV